MTARNERKLQLLHFIVAEEEVTPSLASDTLQLEIHHVRMLLLRYWREGLLYRHIINRKTKQRAYMITEKGKARRKWLETNEPFSFGKMSCAYPRL
jgi:DNA-binding MarR family transcriptional regulator